MLSGKILCCEYAVLASQMKALVLFFALLLPAASLAQAERGAITGTVSGESGRPIAKATVYARNLEGFSGVLPQAISDDSGHFVIEHLAFGSYAVSASRRQSGYPDPAEAFYSGFEVSLPQVTIDEDTPSASVPLSLTRQAAWLSGDVKDDVSGKLIETCSGFRWKDDWRLFLRGAGLVTGKFRVLVPAHGRVTLKVWAWGYEPWYYRGRDASDSLFLQPGEALHIRVRLHKIEPEREPTQTELREMKKSMELSGCSTPEPPDKTN